MNSKPLHTELSKLLREQQALIDDDEAEPLAIEQNNKEVWALRNKYACGSTWGKDPAFDKWWVKQVAKARNLNIIRQIFMWAAVAAVAIWFLTERIQLENDIKNMTPDQYEAYVQQLDPPSIESDP
jgi:hypothetical protein